MILWSQGPAFYVLFRADAERLLGVAREFGATVWEPLLMPLRRSRVN